MSRALTTGALLLLLITACSAGDQPEADPTSTLPSPSPTRSRVETEPVDGEVDVQLVPVANDETVWNRPPPEPDSAAVDAVVDRVRAWLDGHLSDVQEGGEGGFDDVAAPGLLDGVAPTTVAAVTSALASPDRPVHRAAYGLQVAHGGAPQWVRASVHVTSKDGTMRSAQFIFEVVEDTVALVAAGPGAEEDRS